MNRRNPDLSGRDMMRDEYLPKHVTASYLAPVALNPDLSGRGDMFIEYGNPIYPSPRGATCGLQHY